MLDLDFKTAQRDCSDVFMKFRIPMHKALDDAMAVLGFPGVLPITTDSDDLHSAAMSVERLRAEGYELKVVKRKDKVRLYVPHQLFNDKADEILKLVDASIAARRGPKRRSDDPVNALRSELSAVYGVKLRLDRRFIVEFGRLERLLS
jgi:hypothetical protein